MRLWLLGRRCSPHCNDHRESNCCVCLTLAAGLLTSLVHPLLPPSVLPPFPSLCCLRLPLFSAQGASREKRLQPDSSCVGCRSRRESGSRDSDREFKSIRKQRRDANPQAHPRLMRVFPLVSLSHQDSKHRCKQDQLVSCPVLRVCMKRTRRSTNSSGINRKRVPQAANASIARLTSCKS